MMELREFKLIESISHILHPASPEVVCGIGDDCAVIDKKNGFYELLTTDCLVEGVHFDLKYFTAFEIGKKVLAVNLSDIAAMAGKPLYALVSLGVPLSFTEDWITDLYTGLNQMAQEYNVSVVGGNISKSPRDFWINITLIGEVEKKRCRFRSGAKVGDFIFITGPLGSSALGLYLLKKGKAKESAFIRSHKTPNPQLICGHFLGGEEGVTSMIDLSDGLMSDLNHLLDKNEEGLGASLLLEDIPRDKDMALVARENRLFLPDLLLGGGEDYQLLFTVNPDASVELQRRAKNAGYKFANIGSIVPAHEGVKVWDEKGREVKLPGTFEHFY